MKINTKKDRRQRIKFRLRKRASGTSERPRMAVCRSLEHISVQVIDDGAGRTLVSASSMERSVKGTFDAGARGGNRAGARAVGKTVAERLLSQGIQHVVFDRGGFLYHGRVQAVAEAAREAGLKL